MSAWQAYCDARLGGLEIPEWVLKYLDRAAGNIWALPSRCIKGKRVHNFERELAIALEMAKPGDNGRGHVLTDFMDRMWMFYGETVRRYMRQGDKESFAIEAVAKRNGVSTATVRRAWKRFSADPRFRR